MSKRLPYFQFEPAEWMAGNIMFCSLQAQGLFINIKCIYWQKDCILSLEQAKKRFNNVDLFNELIEENIIKIENGFIRIEYLDLQYIKALEKSEKNSQNGALGGRPKKQIESEIKANGFEMQNPNESETKGNKIKENKIKENNSKTIENKIKKETENFKNFEIEKFKDLTDNPTEFIKLWNLWKKYKKEKHKFTFLNDESEQRSIQELMNLSKNNLQTAEKIVNQSIDKGYKGLFEIKENQEYKNTNGKSNTATFAINR